MWGTGGKHAGIPAALAGELPTRVAEAVGKAAERWEGPAFNQFKHWMGNLEDTLKTFSEPAQQVGQLLVDLAEKFELSWLGIVGLVAEIAGLVLAVAGLAALGAPEPVVTKLGGAIIEVAGLVLGIIGMIITLIDEVWPRLQSAKSALHRLTNEINEKIPVTPDAKVPVPTGEWKRKTTDPTS